MKLWISLGFIFYSILNSLRYLFSIVKKSRLTNPTKIQKSQEECLILLNGNSVSNLDLERFVEHDIFTCNFYFDHKFPIIDSQVKFHFFMDNLFYFEKLSYVKKIIALYPKTMFYINLRHLKDELKEFDNVRYLLPAFLSLSKVAIKPNEIYTSFFNVAGYMISVAISLGYKKVYITGLDFNPSYFKHFYDNNSLIIETRDILQIKEDEFHGYIQYSLALWQFYQLREYADKLGVEVINLNPKSYVRAFKYE
jgi:hypothetical protein